MDPIVLTDPTIIPKEETSFARIGDKNALWNTLKEHLYAHHTDLSEEWRFYNDGKCWLFRYLKKGKTICWIAILESTFRVGFWFGEKAEPLIEASDLTTLRAFTKDEILLFLKLTGFKMREIMEEAKTFTVIAEKSEP